MCLFKLCFKTTQKYKVEICVLHVTENIFNIIVIAYDTREGSLHCH